MALGGRLRRRSLSLSVAIFVLVAAGTVVLVNETSSADRALPLSSSMSTDGERARSSPGSNAPGPDFATAADDALGDVTGAADAPERSATTTATTAPEDTTPEADPSHGPYADPRRLVLAAYYPWFDTAAYEEPTLADRPDQPSDAHREADVIRMTRQARAHGIDGFVVSWVGHERNGQQFDLVLDAAAATGGYATAYLETRMANAGRDDAVPPDPQVVRELLYGALARSDHPGFLKKDGVPVVFVYSMDRLPADEWSRILQDFELAGFPVLLVGDGGPSHFDVRWGWHRYSINRRSPLDLERTTRWVADVHRSLEEPRLTVGTVSPGYDDTRLRGDKNPVVRRGPNGERYARTWEAMLAADPDWIFITSWNEWYEGTSIQPGVREGDLAMRQTAMFSARFKA